MFIKMIDKIIFNNCKSHYKVIINIPIISRINFLSIFFYEWSTIWSTLQAHITQYACTAKVWGDGITLNGAAEKEFYSLQVHHLQLNISSSLSLCIPESVSTGTFSFTVSFTVKKCSCNGIALRK